MFGSPNINGLASSRPPSCGSRAKAVRVWGVALETALDRVARDHGVVLLPARAVAAGAPDMTPQVEAMLSAILAAGGSAASRMPAGARP